MTTRYWCVQRDRGMSFTTYCVLTGDEETSTYTKSSTRLQRESVMTTPGYFPIVYGHTLTPEYIAFKETPEYIAFKEMVRIRRLKQEI